MEEVDVCVLCCQEHNTTLCGEHKQKDCATCIGPHICHCHKILAVATLLWCSNGIYSAPRLATRVLWRIGWHALEWCQLFPDTNHDETVLGACAWRDNQHSSVGHLQPNIEHKQSRLIAQYVANDSCCKIIAQRGFFIL